MRVMWHCCKISQFLAFAHESSTSRHLNQGFASFTHAFSVRCRISFQVSIKVYRPQTPPANFMENLTNMTKEWQHIIYRPGQPNWESTMWKSQHFSAAQILREFTFGHFEAPKNCYLNQESSSEFWIFGYFWHFWVWNSQKESHSKASKIVKKPVFDPLKSAKMDFT